MESCLFCRILNKELPSKIAYEDDKVVAFHDTSPKPPVHVLVCPRKHIPTLNDVSTDDPALLAHIFQTARKIAEQFGIAQKGLPDGV